MLISQWYLAALRSLTLIMLISQWYLALRSLTRPRRRSRSRPTRRVLASARERLQRGLDGMPRGGGS